MKKYGVCFGDLLRYHSTSTYRTHVNGRVLHFRSSGVFYAVRFIAATMVGASTLLSVVDTLLLHNRPECSPSIQDISSGFAPGGSNLRQLCALLARVRVHDMHNCCQLCAVAVHVCVRVHTMRREFEAGFAGV